MYSVKYNFFILVFLSIFLYYVIANTSQIKSRNRNSRNPKSKKRQVHVHKHHQEEVQISGDSAHSPQAHITHSSPSILAVLPKASGGDLLEGLFPDIRSCYNGIPRKYERFAKDRMDKRIKECSVMESNTTAWCHKECILYNLGLIQRYTVTIMGTNKKQRRYKIMQKTECGHNMFGQELLGIDTKLWDESRSQKQKKEKELYFEKVNQLAIRNYDPDPFRLKFATVFGEDIVDERLEAQMRICRLFDITVEDVECIELPPQDMHKLVELLQCMETAMTC